MQSLSVWSKVSEMKLTLVATGQSEDRQGPDDPKDIMRQDGIDLSLHRVRPMKREPRPGRGDDLLFLGPSELTQYRLSN